MVDWFSRITAIFSILISIVALFVGHNTQIELKELKADSINTHKISAEEGFIKEISGVKSIKFGDSGKMYSNGTHTIID